VPSIDELLDEARSMLPARAAPEDVAGVLARGGLVIDTRPAAQREADGVLPGAIVVERNVLEWRLDPASAHRLAEVTSYDVEVVVVCNEGYASSLAAATLQRIGLHRATDLAGGFQAWKQLGATPEPPP
jgi:rhodanese-related sulfurtransferase